jgi:heme oxygenase
MFRGDKLENFMVERPTVAQQEYWDFLLAQICMGYNVPRLLVAPYSLQGTVTRADLAVARDAFRRDFELVAAVLQEIYEWWSERDTRHNTANYGRDIPTDHDACEIHPPDGPDVDIGYTAQSLAIEMELGATNLAQICGRRKLNWRTVVRQTAQIEAAIDKEAEAAGIDPARISSKLFKTGRAIAMEETGGDVPEIKPGSSQKTEKDEEILA